MHVEDEVEPLGAAPLHQLVNDAEPFVCIVSQTHVILVGEEPVVEWQAHSIGSPLANEVQVITGDVVLFELLPEAGGLVGAHQLAQHEIDHPRGVGAAETEHIAFGIEPVAQIGTLDEEPGAIGQQEILAAHGDELGGLLGLYATQTEKRQEDE